VLLVRHPIRAYQFFRKYSRFYSGSHGGRVFVDLGAFFYIYFLMHTDGAELLHMPKE